MIETVGGGQIGFAGCTALLVISWQLRRQLVEPRLQIAPLTHGRLAFSWREPRKACLLSGSRLGRL